MAGKVATIYEVALRADVSISTVSLAINQPTRVKAATLARVLAAADELGFVPKERAVIRAREGMGRIATIAPFTAYPSFSRRLAGVLEALGSATQLQVVNVPDIAVAGSPVLASLPLRGHVDGLINLGVPMEPEVGERLRARLPTVLLDVRFPGISNISADFVESGRTVGRFLAELGHKRIAYIRESEQFHIESPTAASLLGLREVFGDGAVLEVPVTRGPSAGADGVRALEDQLDARAVTALVGSRDLVAVGAISELRSLGFGVPDDVSVVGFDDDQMAEALGLTTVRHPYEESGRLAVEELQRRLRDPDLGVIERSIPLTLMKRATTAPAVNE